MSGYIEHTNQKEYLTPTPAIEMKRKNVCRAISKRHPSLTIPCYALYGHLQKDKELHTTIQQVFKVNVYLYNGKKHTLTQPFKDNSLEHYVVFYITESQINIVARLRPDSTEYDTVFHNDEFDIIKNLSK